MSVRVAKIVSGGQTGVDRGALDAAIELGILHRGWCPRGRLAEDGRIPSCHKLQEHQVSVLNIAGPRQSQCPGIAEEACQFVRRLFEAT
jgi:hypothetical protein